MSTINSITSSVISAFQGVGGVTEAAPADAPANSTAPAFQETLTTQSRAFLMGMGAPRNHGDIEALFAEIATKFGAEAAKAGDFASAARDAVRSTALAAAAGSFGFLATFNQIMISAELNIAKQTQTISEKNKLIGELEAQKAPLVQQRDALNAEYWSNVGTIATNVAKITALGTELAGVELARVTACGLDAGGSTCQSLTTQSNNLQSQISALQTQNSNLSARNSQISTEVASLTTQIDALQAQIDTATNERNAATNSLNASRNDYNAALATLTAFAAVLIPFTVALALGQISDGARASFETSPGQTGVDNAIAQAVNRLAELSDEMGKLSQLRQALFQMPDTAPDLTAPTSPGEGGGSTSPTDGSSDADRLLRAAQIGVPATPDPNAAQGVPPQPPSPQSPLPDATVQDPQAGPSGIGQGQPAMEMLRQILANLPLPNAALRPDPQQSGDGQTQSVGSAEKPQNAFDVVRQLLEDMLPPAVGNAQEVATRAGELAAALTLLRSALGQIAQSEASQTPQVPGASGRLNLVI